jgi:hypothetical protein
MAPFAFLAAPFTCSQSVIVFPLPSGIRDNERVAQWFLGEQSPVLHTTRFGTKLLNMDVRSSVAIEGMPDMTRTTKFRSMTLDDAPGVGGCIDIN